MKKIFSTAILLTTFALTACGGGSSSSSGATAKDNKSNDQFVFSVQKKLDNGNEYKCYSEKSFNDCKDDNSCKVAECTFVKGTAPALDLKQCDTEGSNIWGKKGESCQFTIADRNDGKPMILVCDAQGNTIFKSEINDEGIEANQVATNTGTKFLRCQ